MYELYRVEAILYHINKYKDYSGIRDSGRIITTYVNTNMMERSICIKGTFMGIKI